MQDYDQQFAAGGIDGAAVVFLSLNDVQVSLTSVRI